ncbi:hypothetical protein PoB_005244400 [Plakobranchus ocellatus]|uniref:Uncharacterized protein n=1 Tax=Plakobranchus ocellatus TaxID=259542 RepID=A0AAV4C095_9GAST|nr:hypothetical protein PoB_005244400 [Plakobranchus ocellatus]
MIDGSARTNSARADNRSRPICLGVDFLPSVLETLRSGIKCELVRQETRVQIFGGEGANVRGYIAIQATRHHSNSSPFARIFAKRARSKFT